MSPQTAPWRRQISTGQQQGHQANLQLSAGYVSNIFMAATSTIKIKIDENHYSVVEQNWI